MVRSQFNMYNTDASRNVGNLYVNCLRDNTRYDLNNAEMTEYCLDSSESMNTWTDDFLNTHDQNFTFDQLHQMNITTDDLLLWSATIDLAEKYQYYLDHQENPSLSEEIFFNCTQPWFGPWCQYSFLATENTFSSVVHVALRMKFHHNFPSSVIPSTCYTHLECDRGGSGLCLDWREVCDGRIDCLNRGVDEAQCFDLEINECHSNEYRCHNGLCIPKEFLEDSKPQCLDQTDLPEIFYLKIGSSSFDYQEHTCRPGYKQFPCGDGQCVADFDRCLNKRHLLLYQSISLEGNLSDQCWMIMICLTKIADQFNGTTCDYLLKSSNISTLIQICPTFIQFPTVPILFGHVHFLYNLTDIYIDINYPLTPNYICYDEQLCDFLPPMFRNGNYSCRYAHAFGLEPRRNLQNWTSVISFIEPYFRKCLIGWKQKNPAHHSSLYNCKNSSKFISKHRILDSISDCYLNDDEEEQFDLSCEIRDIKRFRCGNEKKCYSIVFSREVCPVRHLRNLDEIEFQEICDRNVQVSFVSADGKSYTDETDCEHWPCKNYYTRCDGFWSCPDGDDEENCLTPQLCSPQTLPCVSPYNYTFSCLSASQVGNGHIDCLGAADERQFCRNEISTKTTDEGFCCRDGACLSIYDLCNGEKHCLLEIDKAFCEDHNYTYSHTFEFSLNIMKKALCHLKLIKKIPFSLETSSEYPLLNKRASRRIIHQPVEQQSMKNFMVDELVNSTWPWLCNHGLYVRHWLGNNNFSYKCFCSPGYYGELCQYQNQRVSFTADVRTLNSQGIYTILVILFDDDEDREEINSYQLFIPTTIIRCQRHFNTYLTYSRRPKNISKTYSVRVDVFDKTNLTYLVSWHFSIPFSFLPVNRMAVILDIPAHHIASPTNCTLICDHGKCMKYFNKDKEFCRCDMGWSGARCHIPIHCGDCSSDSICAGIIHNRSICICPFHKSGPRCLLQLSCPTDICMNNADCLVIDESGGFFPYICICPKQYFGSICELSKSTLEIVFDNIEISSHLLAYIVHLDTNDYAREYGRDRMSINVMPKKLTMFQRSVVLLFDSALILVFVKMDTTYYLAVVQHEDRSNISTSINPARRCKDVSELLSARMLSLPEIQRVKYYPVLCKTHSDLLCFYDEYYMCLCTFERHANCLKFDHNPTKCRIRDHCLNGGTCLYFDPVCRYETTCICPNCFYGDLCQYYAEGIGLTLDDILRYAIRSNTTINDQSSTIKWSSTWTIILFVLALINSILSLMTFITKASRAVGCGLYLCASSITSLLTMCMFIVKFWFILLTQMNGSVNQSLLRGGCISIEFILKVCLYTDNWLNACVSLERSITLYKGVNFNRMLTKHVAKWIIIILPLVIGISLIHEPLNRDIFDDKDENRFWCVFHYSSSIRIYNTIILTFHFLGPFGINLFSAFFIIFSSARRRAIAQQRHTFREHLRQQWAVHKNLIISPIILIVLGIPRLIISFFSGCTKVSQNVWLYLLGYFISFIPSIIIFIVFALPSEFYRKQFKASFEICRRRNP